jgi:BASS family bile acid:Na+ symporter
VLAIFLTPFNFSWTMASNPATADWLRSLALSPLNILASLLILLALPMLTGLLLARHLPHWAIRWRRPLRHVSLLALATFIVLGLYRDRALLNAAILLPFAIVVLHNGLGFLLGDLTARGFQLQAPERRAITVEAGMQNAGLALGIIALQFDGELGMVVLASLWGIWHLISGLTLAWLWRRGEATEHA